MKKIYRFLGSLKVAIFWLIFLGFLVILGAVVPQGGPEQILEGTLPDWLKNILISIKAYDAYHSPLFLGSLTAFYVTLLIATYEKVWPIFLTVLQKTKTPPARSVARFPLKTELKYVETDKALEIITKHKYKLVNENKGLYHFEKGKWAKSSAMIAHISLFMILSGIIYGVLTSFFATIALVPGESAPVSYLVSQSKTKGRFVDDHNDKWALKVNRFWIDYHPSGEIKQYYSDLSVLDTETNKELLKKTIWVNEPLVYNGVYFYQASWGVSHLLVNIDGKDQNIILNQLKSNQGNVSDKIKFGNNEYIFFLNQQNEVYLFNLDAEPVMGLQQGRAIEFEGSKIEFKEIVLFTGLQYKKDKGITTVYVGFVVLIIALIINFFTHRQIWLVENEGKFYLVGKTKRGTYLLEQEVNKIADLIEMHSVSVVKDTTNV